MGIDVSNSQTELCKVVANLKRIRVLYPLRDYEKFVLETVKGVVK